MSNVIVFHLRSRHAAAEVLSTIAATKVRQTSVEKAVVLKSNIKRDLNYIAGRLDGALKSAEVVGGLMQDPELKRDTSARIAILQRLLAVARERILKL